MADGVATTDPVFLPQPTNSAGVPIGVPTTGNTGGTMIPGANPGQDWGALLASIFGGVNALKGKPTNDAQTVANYADPYNQQRSQWWPQIQQLMANPTSALQDPSFTAPLKLGGEAVARQFGAQGMGISGNEDAALQDYGQTQAMGFLQQRLNNLINLGGVNAGSPAAAAQAIQGGQNATTQGIAGLSGPLGALLGGLIGPAGGALGSLLKMFQPGGGGVGTTDAGSGAGFQTGDNGTLGSSDWEGANSSTPPGLGGGTGGFNIPSDDWGDIDWSNFFTD